MEINLESPGFSKFRSLMDIWDEYLLIDDIRHQIESMMDPSKFVFFFKFNKEVFGSDEDSRVAFAKMKNPDDDMPKNWEDEVNFAAENFNKMIRGEPATQIFHKKDLDKIKIIERDKAVNALQKVAEENGSVKKKHDEIEITLPHHDRDEAPNFIRADED